MPVSTLNGLFKVTRPINGLIGLWGSWMGARLASCAVSVSDPAIWLAAIGIALAILAADAINDVFDVDIDRVNRPGRPLPSGAVTTRQVIALVVILDALALACATLAMAFGAPWSVPALTLGAILANMLYSWKLKRQPLIGNLTISSLYAVPVALGGLAQNAWGELTVAVILTILFALGREILQDVRDLRGDSSAGARTLPGVIGERAAMLLALGCYTVAIVLGLSAGFSGPLGLIYRVIITLTYLAIVLVVLRAWRSRQPADFKRSAGATKVALAVAMLALTIAPACF